MRRGESIRIRKTESENNNKTKGEKDEDNGNKDGKIEKSDTNDEPEYHCNSNFGINII